MNSFLIFSNGTNFMIKEKSNGLYDAYANNILTYTDLHSKHEHWNDDFPTIIKELKNREKIKKLQKMNLIDNDEDMTKTYYPSRIAKCFINKMQKERIENGLNITSFINEAIAEKLIKEGLL